MQKLLVALFFLFLSLTTTSVLAQNNPVIAAASSLKFALLEISESFTKQTGHQIRISFSSSGNLTRQILLGAPFELFLSADQAHIDPLVQQGKTSSPPVTYALGRVALIAPANSSLPLDENLLGIREALQHHQLQRIAIANPELAPYGFAAKTILQHLKLWDDVVPLLVNGENVAQATQYVSSGSAQLGLVSYSLTLSPQLQTQLRHILLPASMHAPLLQTMVLLKGAGETARLFFDYLQQPVSQAIFARYGYDHP
jgi:molybdate transport system substrate-binding protein